jgi:hypothetical protein
MITTPPEDAMLALLAENTDESALVADAPVGVVEAWGCEVDGLGAAGVDVAGVDVAGVVPLRVLLAGDVLITPDDCSFCELAAAELAGADCEDDTKLPRLSGEDCVLVGEGFGGTTEVGNEVVVRPRSIVLDGITSACGCTVKVVVGAISALAPGQI